MRVLILTAMSLVVLSLGIPGRVHGFQEPNIPQLTPQEYTHPHGRLMDWVTPYARLKQDGTIGRAESFRGWLHMDVDSNEVVHTATTRRTYGSDGVTTTGYQLIYQNNLSQTRRTNGFSDPFVVCNLPIDPIGHSDDTTFDFGIYNDQMPFNDVDIITDKDDKVYVIWNRPVYRYYFHAPGEVPGWTGFPGKEITYVPRVYYRCRSNNGEWGPVIQVTPEIADALVLPAPPPTNFPRRIVGTGGGSPLVKAVVKGADGYAYLMSSVAVDYEYDSVFFGSPLARWNNYGYTAYSKLGESLDFHIIPVTVSHQMTWTANFEQDEAGNPIPNIEVGGYPSPVIPQALAVTASGSVVLLHRSWNPSPDVFFNWGVSGGNYCGLDTAVQVQASDDMFNPVGLSYFFDSQGNDHLYWNDSRYFANWDLPFAIGKYRKGLLSPTTDVKGVNFVGKVVIDALDHHHFFSTLPTWGYDRAVTILSRWTDPETHQLADSFIPTGALTLDYNETIRRYTQNFYDTYLWFLSPNGRLYMPVEDQYTCSMSNIMGLRDPGAGTPIFPGGQLNVTNGAVFARIPLFSTAGVGPTQSIDVIYNPLEPSPGSAGMSWKLSTDIYLIDHWYSTLSHSGNVITLVLGDGRQVKFSGFGTLTPMGDFSNQTDYGVLRRLSSDTLNPEYELVTGHGDHWFFNNDGRLRRIENPAGQYMEFQYTAGVLTRISDVNGSRSSGLAYDVSPRYGARVTGIGDPGSGVYDFEYLGNKLASVTFSHGPGAPKYGFEYYSSTETTQGKRPGMLSKWKMPRGNSYELLYHPNRRLSEVRDPSAAYLLEGAPDALGATTQVAKHIFRYLENTTWMTDRRGLSTSFGVSGPFVYSIADEESRDSSSAAHGIFRDFDAAGNLTDLTDRRGSRIKYIYGNAPNPNSAMVLYSVLRSTPEGGELEQVSGYTYTKEGFNQVETETTYATQPGGGLSTRTTTYHYNGYRQLTQIDHPDVLLPDGTPQTGVTSKFEYSSGPLRQMLKSTNERGNSTDFSDFDSRTGLPHTIKRPGGSQAEVISYDNLGNIFQVVRPKGGSDNDGTNPTTFYRDGMYRLEQVVDPAGQTTSYGYDVDSNQTSVQLPGRLASTTEYDSRGYPFRGRVPESPVFWTCAVDGEGNVRRTTDVRGATSRFSLDAIGRVSVCRTEGGTTVGAGSGGGGDATQTMEYHYELADENGRYSTVTAYGAPNKRVIRTDFDGRSRPVRVTGPDGLTKSETFYNEQDQVVAQQVVYGSTLQTCTVLVRDARDRVFAARTQNAAFGGNPTQSSSTYFFHNEAGSIETVVDPLGDFTSMGHMDHKTKYGRDARERVETITDGKDRVIREFTYGDDDLVSEIKVPDPEKKSQELVTAVKYAYTSRKEAKSVVNKRGEGLSYQYGPLAGQVTTVTDALGRQTKTTYLPGTQLVDSVIAGYGTSEAASVGHVWQDGLLAQTKHYNPETGGIAIHSREYDKSGRLERVKAPSTQKGIGIADLRIYYNSFGQSSITIQGLKTTSTQYDIMGRADTVLWHGTDSVVQSRMYNGLGMLKSVEDAGSSFGVLKKIFEYETWKGTPKMDTFEMNGLAWKTQVHSTDVAGNYISYADPNENLHEWPVDENNRPTAKLYMGVVVATLTYTVGGLLDTETIHNSSGLAMATTTYEYDDVGRVKKKSTIGFEPTVNLGTYEYEYFETGEVKSVNLTPLGVKVTYTYTSRGELKNETIKGNSGGNAPDDFGNPFVDFTGGNESVDSSTSENASQVQLAVSDRTAVYEYDEAGNRTKVTINGAVANFEYNSLSQLMKETWPEKVIAHDYDERGNEIYRKTTEGGSVIEERYGYNYLELLSTYAKTAGDDLLASWQYDYWPTGERFSKTNLKTNEKTLFICRGGDVAVEYDQVLDGPLSGKSTYVQGLGIDTKSTRILPNGERRHFVGDQVGTLGLVLDDVMSVVERNMKDAWGVQLAGGSAERFSGVAQRENDPESGLVYMRSRYYDPRMGRFTQTDPIIGNQSSKHYTYAANNPISRIDPMGTQDHDSAHGPPVLRKDSETGESYFCTCMRNPIGLVCEEYFGCSPKIGRELAWGCACNWTSDKREQFALGYGKKVTGMCFDMVKAAPGANALVAAEQLYSGYSVSMDRKPVSATATGTELLITTAFYVGLKAGGDYASELSADANCNLNFSTRSSAEMKLLGSKEGSSAVIEQCRVQRFFVTRQMLNRDLRLGLDYDNPPTSIPVGTTVPEGDFIWVQESPTRFVFAPREFDARNPIFPHPYLSNGRPVLSGGEGIGRNGVILYLNRNTGHFRVSEDSFDRAVLDLRATGRVGVDTQVESGLRESGTRPVIELKP